MNERFQFFDIYLNIEAALAHKNTHTVLMHRMAVIQCGDSIRARSAFFFCSDVCVRRELFRVFRGKMCEKKQRTKLLKFYWRWKSFLLSRRPVSISLFRMCCMCAVSQERIRILLILVSIRFVELSCALCSVLCSSWENSSMNKMLVINQLCWGCTEIVVNFYPNFRKFI